MNELRKLNIQLTNLWTQYQKWVMIYDNTYVSKNHGEFHDHIFINEI